MDCSCYDEDYYRKNKQDRDRPALSYYHRLAKKYFDSGDVLDFGCGLGFFLKRLRRSFRVHGFELSDYCKETAISNCPGIEIFSNLKELPSRRYSGITALHVFEHICDSELDGVLEQLKRALVPGGRILCVMPDLSGWGRCLKGDSWGGFLDPSHVNLKSSSTWVDYFSGSGFEVLKVGTDGLWDLPYPLTFSNLVQVPLGVVGAFIQFVLGRLFLRGGHGESVVLLLEKRV